MPRGYLVQPDLTAKAIEFEIDDAAQYIGGTAEDRVAVAFQQRENATLAALHMTHEQGDGVEPNAVASMAKNEAATGNSAFFTDPTAAVIGPVIFVGPEGEDISFEQIALVDDGIRAVKNYMEDEPEDFALWRAAALNLPEPQ